MRPTTKRNIRSATIGFVVSASISLNLLVAGIWLHGQERHPELVSSSRTSTNSAGQYLVSHEVAVAVVDDIGTPDLSSTPHGVELIEAARDVCISIMPKGDRVCQELPITVQELSGRTIGMVLLIEDPTTAGVYARQMRLSPKIELSDHDPMGLNYYLAHEWMHVRLTQIAKTPEGRTAMHTRAMMHFNARTGARVDIDRGGEMLNDCDTWDVLGQPSSFVPAYLHGYDVGPEQICADWRSLLIS